MGWYSEGPFENADDLKGALKRAIEQVKKRQARSHRRGLRPQKSRVRLNTSPAPSIVARTFMQIMRLRL